MMGARTAQRFSPGSFAYNSRVACGVLPAMAVMLGFGGTVASAICLLGAIASYMLDAFRYKEGALAVIWVTLAVTNLSLISASSSGSEGSRPLLLSLCMLGSCSAVLFQAGCWATLQFRWVQMQYPPVVLALERLTVSGCVTCCGPMVAWGLVAAVGASSTPFYLAFVMSGYYLLCGPPLLSSFHGKSASLGGTSSEDWYSSQYIVQGRFETACLACFTSALPVGLYAALHRNVLLEMNHFWSLLLLAPIPVLAITLAPHGLWWLPVRKSRAQIVRYACALAAFALLVAGVEGRLIFSSFRQYILIHPPFDWILVSLAIYGHGAALLLHLSGALHHQAVHAAALVGLLLCCLAACLAVGLPLYVIPGPLISATGLGVFYRTRSMREYTLFLAGAGIAGVWFISHHFWFLAISWTPDWNVQSICKLLFLYTGPTLLLPGTLLSGAAGWVSGLVLVCHAALLLVTEIALVTGNQQFKDMYPAYATVATSAAGVFVVSHLADRKQDLPAWTSWCALVLYAAKASVLVLPAAFQAVHVGFLAAAASAPLILHPAKTSSGRNQRISASVGAMYTLLICVASWQCRHSVFAALANFAVDRLEEGFAIGALLLITAVALFPLLTTHYPRAPLPRLAVLLLISSGFLLLAVQPPLPEAVACRPGNHISPHRFMCLPLFQTSDAVVHQVDDIAIYGSGVGRRKHWGSWLLVLACLAGLAAGGQQRAARGAGLIQIVSLSLVSGGAVGGYIALELFAGQLTLQLIILGTCLLVSTSVVLLSFPIKSSPTSVPVLLLIWAALLPAALLLEREAPMPANATPRLYPDAPAAMEEHRSFRSASLVATYAVQSALLAFCVKIKSSHGGGIEAPGVAKQKSASPAIAASSGSGTHRPMSSGLTGFLGNCLPQSGVSLSAHARASNRMKHRGDPRLQLQGLGWLPTVGNLITLLSFSLNLFLGVTWFDGGETLVLPLASLLLLLHQDPVLFQTLSDQKRYAPPVLALVCYLSVMSMRSIFSGDAPTGTAAVAAVAGELVCLALPLPSLTLFLAYLWSSMSRSSTLLLVAAPLNLIALAITQLSSIRLLATAGLIAAACQWFAMSHTHRAGLRLL